MGLVVCAGSINMDIVAAAVRHPAPGETVPGLSLSYFPGGKGANQAVAAARMGASTLMLGRVGDDAFGASLLSFLASAGVDTSGIVVGPGASGTALITVAEAENAIVVVPGANGLVEAGDVVGHAGAGDVVVGQFEIPVDVTTRCFEAAKRAGALTVLNPTPAADIPSPLRAATDVVVLNEVELAHMSGGGTGGDAARRLRRDESQVVIVTLGAAGAVVVDGGNEFVVPGRPADAVDTTGAGDCFVGALAAQLCRGSALRTAVEVANAAAAISVTRPGAGPSMPTWDEVQRALSGAGGNGGGGRSPS